MVLLHVTHTTRQHFLPRILCQGLRPHTTYKDGNHACLVPPPALRSQPRGVYALLANDGPQRAEYLGLWDDVLLSAYTCQPFYTDQLDSQYYSPDAIYTPHRIPQQSLILEDDYVSA